MTKPKVYLLNPEAFFAGGTVEMVKLDEYKKLEDFKTFVHKTLDAMGVPAEIPESEHTKAGCRIGGRMEWVKEKLDELAMRECDDLEDDHA